MSRLINIAVLISFILITYGLASNAQQPIDWQYIETDNFIIIYHPEVEKQAYVAAETAEEVFSDLSSFTGFTPYRKVAIIISAQDDIANGKAIPRDWIYIWANPLYTATRVDQQWLQNVITHELTHIVQTEATFGATYQLHKLTGASTILGLPPNFLHPRWFLEGVAQYGTARQGYDALDRKRQMIMEQEIQSEEFFTDSEIIWGRSPIGLESAYNFGFGFIDYLMRTYGEERFIELQQAQNDSYFSGLDEIFHQVYQKNVSSLVEEWKGELRTQFPRRNRRDPAVIIEKKPDLARWSEPVLTPEGGVIFTQSHVDRPSLQIKYWHPKEGLITLLDSPSLAQTRLALSKDGQKLLYTSYQYHNQHLWADLYEMDLENLKISRLTREERILQAVHYQDGYLVVKNDWGKQHLYLLDQGSLKQITATDFNFTITDLAISPDEKRLAINFNYNGRRGIALMTTELWQFEKIFFPPDAGDWLLGDFSDNEHLTFSWDYLNHYDLYRLNLSTGLIERLTFSREDILVGYLTDSSEEPSWIGQIYDPTGFTLARGLIDPIRVLTLKPEEIAFAATSPVNLIPVKQGKYRHYHQLRSDLLLPVYGIENEDVIVGLSHLITDPLQELTFYYDLSWNLEEAELLANLEVNWSGSNPGIGLSLNIDQQEVRASLYENYEFYPYNLRTTQYFKYAHGLVLDQLQLELSRVWFSKYPAKTRLQGNYYPQPSTAGYDLTIQHQQNFPIGYNGDSLTSRTVVGYAGGKSRFSWGQGDLLWVYGESSLAEALVTQKLNYQHNLLDLSTNITNLIQVGRLYTNLFGELGLFYADQEYITANMFGIGLEYETLLLNLIPMNYQLSVATNTSGDLKLLYGINMSF